MVADVGVGVTYWWRFVGGGEDDAKRSVHCCNNQISGVILALISTCHVSYQVALESWIPSLCI